MKGITILNLALTVVSMATVANSQTNTLGVAAGGVSTWSVQTNTPQWNRDLGVTYTRQGCSDPPASCMSFTGRIAQSDNVKVVLAIPLNSTTTAAYARQYSQLSLTSPFLAEISIDDFVDQYRALSKVPYVNPAAVLAQVIANVKADNARLAFGATIYEDQLVNTLLQNASLPATLRDKFDYIHLFIHYRENGPNFSAYVARAKLMFPHAHIIAGSYALDRRAAFSCAQSGTAACTIAQDFDLFKQSLTAQVQELKQGSVDRIEFYPGYFGTESQYPSWSDPRHCPSGEIEVCIANTIVMRDAALAILNGEVAPPTWFQLAPTGSSPVARYNPSAAYDSANHRMIVFGGSDWTGDLNDTWLLVNADGQHGAPAWYQLATAGAPPAGYYSTGMYDPNSNRMIVFGGAGTDVWVLTNANATGTTQPTWTKLKTSATISNLPTILTDWEKCTYDPVRNVMMVYDSTAGVWVLTHANGLGGTPTWTLLTIPGTGPSGRAAFTTVYDPASNRMIVFGGGGGGVDFNDMWALTNANGQSGSPAWIPLPAGTATLPAPRSGHTAVYDPASDSMTIFGGIGLPAETWTAKHASGLTKPPVWTLVDDGTLAPAPRVYESAVLDTNSFSMIVFAGLDTDIRNTVEVLTPVL
jgi:hypothetical protein